MEQIIYSAITWVDEKNILGQEYVNWLEKEHLPELSSQPGFNSVRRVKIEELDENKFMLYHRDGEKSYHDSKGGKPPFSAGRWASWYIKVKGGWERIKGSGLTNMGGYDDFIKEVTKILKEFKSMDKKNIIKFCIQMSEPVLQM